MLSGEEYKTRRQMRVDVMNDTKRLVRRDNYAHFLQIAAENLETAEGRTEGPRQELEQGPVTVSVIQRDCLEAAADLLKTFGVKPVVLNMANARGFGGGYLSGAGAQEENMFRRTGCYLNTGKGVLGEPPDESMVRPDGSYRTKMSDQIYGVRDFVPVFDAVCLKTEEADGYQLRPRADIFPFYELRSAAQNISDPKKHRPFDEALCEQQIRAQFRSLRMIGAKIAVLSAFGCGAFKNPPQRVAAVYKRVMDDVFRRNECPLLKKIVYALINPNDPTGDPGDNLTIFRDVLSSGPVAGPSGPVAGPVAASNVVDLANSPDTPLAELPPGVYILMPDDTWSKFNERQELAYFEALKRPGPHINIDGRDLGISGRYKFTRDSDGNLYYSFAREDTLMLIKEISPKTKRRKMGGRRTKRR